MIKKIIKMTLLTVMALGIFTLSACKNSHGIPNGKYGFADMNSYTLIGGDVPDNDYYIRIRGNKAISYSSNLKSHTYKIIEENDKIYFYRENNGETFKFEVEYDNATKTFTLSNVITK